MATSSDARRRPQKHPEELRERTVLNVGDPPRGLRSDHSCRPRARRRCGVVAGSGEPSGRAERLDDRNEPEQDQGDRRSTPSRVGRGPRPASENVVPALHLMGNCREAGGLSARRRTTAVVTRPDHDGRPRRGSRVGARGSSSICLEPGCHRSRVAIEVSGMHMPVAARKGCATSSAVASRTRQAR